MSIYKKFDLNNDVVFGNPTEVTTGLWSGDTGSLSAFYTSSAQISDTSGQYYWNIFNVNPNATSSAEVQFAVAYGHRTGGGQASLTINANSTLSTQAVYHQYRNLLLNPDDPQFTFDGGYNSDHIYIINVQRARLRETLDPGNWQLTLSGSFGKFTFIDDSGQTLGASFGKAGAEFNVVSGTLSGGVSGSALIATTASSAKGGFGLVYPSLGLVVLNPDAIAATVGFTTASYPTPLPFAPHTGSVQNEVNHAGLFNSIALGGSFLARSAETISSTHYFVRLYNKEFNYSNNPSFYDETTGTLENASFVDDPRVYVTTIGLYNDNNELLAVAKLSKPVQKSFVKEQTIRVRLDW